MRTDFSFLILKCYILLLFPDLHKKTLLTLKLNPELQKNLFKINNSMKILRLWKAMELNT